MLKVALCFSGHLRTFNENYHSIYQHLLSNPNYKCDTFIHTWDKLDYTYRYQMPIWGITREMHRVYKPKLFVIDKPLTFPETISMRRANGNYRNISNVLGMFFKVKACNDLKSQYENSFNFKYDCVIRIRPDIRLNGLVNLNTDLTKLNIPIHGDYGGINDQFAFANSHIIDQYCSTYNNIPKFIEKGSLFNPEFFVAQNIKEYELEMARPYIPYVIRWMNGLELNNEIRSRG